VVFSDIGPDLRWVGNESGMAGDPDWNLLDTAGFSRGAGAPPADTLNHGNANGAVWIPAECDVSIRPGWFYHKSEDEKVKSPEELFQLYLQSVGRGAYLLLNVPPDRRGLINEHDSAALVGFRKLREENFSKPIAIKKSVARENTYSIKMNKISAINCIVLREAIQSGQKIKSFTVTLKKNKDAVKEIDGSTIGRKRILTFSSADANAVDIKVRDARSNSMINDIEVYHIDEKLVEKK
jgi:alpha-L-fucosidase